jgi:2-O-(6-phospho-alpha-D-mannosyl)-D-glycerate hydrolase
MILVMRAPTDDAATAGTSPSRTVYLVPHTHWDREWYEPFQRFRMRLVDLLDHVLERAEADPGFRFTMDGQMAAIEDYLEIRPEAAPRVRALVDAGRLAIGPWQILSDEFLASGETLVRNLERGLASAARLGGAMRVGYLPDQFGHAAQMPQILHRAGFEHAVVWRGVPSAVAHHAFLWSAPDGSTVRAEYLPWGYSNAALLLELPDRLTERVRQLDERMRPYLADGNGLLAMYGDDHSRPLLDLMSVLTAINAAQDVYRIRTATLAGYLDEVGGRRDGLPSWRGELRSSARANLLMGVLSARIGLKAALGRAERLLERYAEPLHALHCRHWPRRFLELGWNKVIDSSGHDSITGCGADPVAQQVAARLAEAEQIGSGLRDRAADEVALRVPAGAVVVLNPSPAAREGLVELDVEAPDDWDELALELPDGRLLATQELSRRVPVRYGFTALPEPTRLETEGPPRRRLLASVPVPPLGWTAARPRPGRGEPPAAGPVGLDRMRIANGLVEAQVRPDGCLRISGGGASLDGVARLVDGGDAGDSYTYAPPTSDREVSEPETVTVVPGTSGPLRAAVEVVRTYRWPRGLDGAGGAARSGELVEVRVTTTVELRAGEPFVRLRVWFDNPCVQHRVRLHVPLATAAGTSAAEGQFAVVERGPRAEGGHGELPLPTFPARGFVAAGGAGVLLDHVTEYELVGEGSELAVTLLRSVGLISRNTNPYRVEPAGPEVEIPDAQGIGPVTATLAVLPYRGTWAAAGLGGHAERYRHDLVAAPGRGPEGALEAVAGLQIAGDGGTALSSLRRRHDWLELRLVREHPDAGTATISGKFTEARSCDLLGRPGPPLPTDGATTSAGTLHLDLQPWEIRTLQLR